MHFIPLARRYRPQQFSEVVGQEAVVRTLCHAIELERLAPAYVLSGVRGTGKTTLARLLAKAVRCSEALPKKSAVMCGQCDECQLVASGRSLAVLELDGASHNGVDEIRTLLENIAYPPPTGKYKVYLIDEVHMLSQSAFNALLKTLEEPPRHALFIFATTELHKIPLTILSRCQRMELQRLTLPQITQALSTILDQENRLLQQSSLEQIAREADGSLRDALSLLDQVLSFLGSQAGNPSENQVESLSEAPSVTQAKSKEAALVSAALGIPERQQCEVYFEAVWKGDVKKMLQEVAMLYRSGIRLESFCAQCLDWLRDLYHSRILGEDTTSVSSAVPGGDRAVEARKGITLLGIERMSQILFHVQEQLRFATHPLWLVELASVRMAHACRLGDVVLEALESPKVKPRETMVSAPPPPPAVPAALLSSVPSLSQANRSPLSQGGEWERFVAQVVSSKPVLGSLLSFAAYRRTPTTPQAGEPFLLEIAFVAGSFYAKQAQEFLASGMLLAEAKKFLGDKVTVAVVGGEKTIPPAFEPSLQSLQEKAVSHLQNQKRQHPLVQEAITTLGAEVVGVYVAPDSLSQSAQQRGESASLERTQVSSLS